MSALFYLLFILFLNNAPKANTSRKCHDYKKLLHKNSQTMYKPFPFKETVFIFQEESGDFFPLAVCSLFSFPPTNRSSIQLIVHQNDHFLLHDEKN